MPLSPGPGKITRAASSLSRPSRRPSASPRPQPPDAMPPRSRAEARHATLGADLEM